MSVFRKLSFASKISSRSAINVTQDSVISICTEEGIYILVSEFASQKLQKLQQYPIIAQLHAK